MRGWLIPAGILILIIVLPLVALTDYFGSLAKMMGQIVLSIVLVVALVGSSLFGYICFKAQARKWGAGLLVAAVLCVIALILVIFGHLPFI